LIHEDDDDDDDEEEEYGDNDDNEENCGINNNNTKKKSNTGRKKNANYVSQLGRDKGILAELEEEVCKRMDGLVQMSIGNSSTAASDTDQNDNDDVDVNTQNNINRKSGSIDVFDQTVLGRCKTNGEVNSGVEEFMSMEKLCQKLFDDDKSDCKTNNNEDGGNNSGSGGNNDSNHTDDNKQKIIPRREEKICEEKVSDEDDTHSEENSCIFNGNHPATQNHTQGTESEKDVAATLGILQSLSNYDV